LASASDVVKIANQEATLAIKGRPNKYTRWYGFTDEWCAMFVSWCLNQAGVPTSIAPKTAAVSGFLDFAKKNNRYYSKTSGYKPKPGDIMIQKNGCSHTGLVVSASGNSFTTVEGNSSNAVKTRNYTLSSNELSGFFSPAYSAESASPATIPTKTITLPSGLGSVFTYMGWQLITSKTSVQYKLKSQAGQNFDSEGFGIINGRYVVACTTTYGSVGDYIDVYQSNGNVLKCIIGDIKNQNDAGCNKWGHLSGKCVIEFVVDKSKWYNPKHANPGTSSCHPEWGAKTITKIVNLGSYFSGASADGGMYESDTKKKDKVDLCSTSVISVVNVAGTLNDNAYINIQGNKDARYELHIINKGVDYQPLVVGEVTWTTEWKDAAGKLEFTVLKDPALDIQEGNVVAFLKNGVGVFYGYLFSKSRSKGKEINCTAYDQLRYLKNKDTYCYKNKTLRDVIIMIAIDYRLKVSQSKLVDTKYSIPGRVEDNETLFDIIKNARELTESATGNMYIFYDDYGLLCLKRIEDLKTDYLLDDETCEDMDYTSSIDDEVYNQIQFYRDDDTTGNRAKYIFRNAELINKWGVLQLTCKLEKDDNPAAFGKSVLKLYSEKKRELTVKDCFGDIRLRAGASIYANLNLGDIVFKSAQVIIKKAVHRFGTKYSCDLTLLGGSPYVS
jgi:hypothetical protein